MIAYNAVDFDPPAPVAYVTLRNSATYEEWQDVPMLLDSGADVSLVPQMVVNRLNLTVVSNQHYDMN